MTTIGVDPAGGGARPPPARFGDYRILDELGRGGMGVVYLAEHVDLGRRVALKVLSGRFAASERVYQRFEREVRAIARLQHRRIVPVFEVGQCAGSPYFTMEYVEGAALHEILSRLRADAPAFADLRPRHLLPDGAATDTDGSGQAWAKSYLEAACRLLVQIAEGLQHAHDHGVIHRDVKPNNIMVARDGRAMLFDFGLAKIDTEDSLTLSGEFVGTPHYVSPEQAAPRGRALDGRTDVFSLGVTLYELLTLQLPFDGDTPHEVFRQIATHEPRPLRRLNPLVPRDLQTICMTAMEKDPARRYPTPLAMAHDLQRFLEFKPVEARPVGQVTRAIRWVRRNAAAAALGAALVVALVASLFGSWQYVVGRAVAASRDLARAASARAHYHYAVALAQRGLWGDALGYFARARDDGYDDPVGLAIARIEALEGKGELAAARAEVAALAARPDLGAHRAAVLLLQADLGVDRNREPNWGLDRVATARELAGLDPAGRSYADALLAADLTAVVDALRATLAQQPFHRRAHESLVPVLISLGALDEAGGAAQRMASLYPEDAHPVLLAVVVHTLRGDLAAAGAQLEAARALLPAAQHPALLGWAGDLARSAQLQAQLVATLLGGGAPLDPGRLAWELLWSPSRVLPGIPGAAGGGWLLPFRLAPALARSYRPLTDFMEQNGVQENLALRPEHLHELIAILDRSLAAQPDGYRHFVRGFYRYQLCLARPELRVRDLPAAERDFAAAAVTPSMFRIDKAALFFALETQRLRRRDAPAGDPQLVARAAATLTTLVDRRDLGARELAFVVRLARDFGQDDLANEAALRARRTREQE